MTPPASLPPQDEAFIRDLQTRCYQFFLDAADSSTGLVSDRGARDGSGFSEHASSASCGFALASYAIAPKAELESFDSARERSRTLLRSLLYVAEHHNGFVYHFIGRADGGRRMNCEASTVDTALMLAGVMCAETTFGQDPEIRSLCQDLVNRTDWQSMLSEDNLMHMGWTPEEGLLPYQWDRFSELTILVLMAIGAPRHAIDPACWHAWRRDQTLTHRGESFLSYPPLFVHQYPMAFFDFRNVRSPNGRSYWQNSITAHFAQIEFLTQLGQRYPDPLGHYGDKLWGITSSDSVSGYRDWGGPYEDNRFEPDRGIDGTVVPSAAAGGLAAVPDQSLTTLRYQREHFGDAVYGRYGFANAFNPATGWVSQDVIGIDTGISLLMAENLRSGGVWDAFMRHPVAQAAFERTGFR
ncbi:glucoamylase family protein [Neorhodopirellula pilleata]|nr:glucoamylase family protein [Neorhodopirellula pilleata]